MSRRSNHSAAGLVASGLVVGLALGAAAGSALVETHLPRLAAAAPAAAAPAEPPSPARPASNLVFVGVLAPVRSVEVRSLVEGRILRVNVALGDRVRAGDPLVTLDPEPLRQELEAARAAVATSRAVQARALAEYRQSRSSHRRLLALGDYVSREERANGGFAVSSRLADLRAAEATIAERLARQEQITQALANLEIRAPFEGVVAHRSVEVGAAVGRDVPVVRLASDGLVVRFAIDPERAEELKAARHVSVLLPATGSKARAVLERIAPESDSATQIIVGEARLDAVPPGAGFTPGLMVRVSPSAS